jgi:hypothetical protein
MNDMSHGIALQKRLPASEEQTPEKSLDAAWLVLEAANDLGDQATVDACRRVIDAGLNGAFASQADLHVVTGYFR